MEALLVDDQDAAGFQILDVRLQRGGIHGDEDVQVVAGREHRQRGEVQLEGADPGERPRGGADLGGKVRERREIVAGECGPGGELHPGDLHAVTGITREADDDRVALLDRLRQRRYAVRHF